MINWMYFPKSQPAPPVALAAVRAFENVEPAISSADHELSSNEVLAAVRPGLEAAGFRVETGKKQQEKIHVPVLFGRNGAVEKAFEADALHEGEGFVLEVEAGRGVVNNQFLKDLFQACMMHDVCRLGIAVRNVYSAGGMVSHDFDRVLAFFDTLYASNRIKLPLEGVLIVGY